METSLLEKRSMDDLRREVAQTRRDTGLDAIRSQVVLVIDRSPSMEDGDKRFFTDGVIEGLVTRCMALALEFDDDGEVPVYALDESYERMPLLTMLNLEGYVKNCFARLGSGTRYAPSMRAVLEDAKPNAAGDPMLVLFFTDGENFDQTEATDMIRQASNYPIFWQFFGIHGRNRPQFTFLQTLDTLTGRLIDNAGFSELGLLTITDEQLFAEMVHEYRDYPDKARRAGLLPWRQDNIYRARDEEPRRGWMSRMLGR